MARASLVQGLLEPDEDYQQLKRFRLLSRDNKLYLVAGLDIFSGNLYSNFRDYAQTFAMPELTGIGHSAENLRELEDNMKRFTEQLDLQFTREQMGNKTVEITLEPSQEYSFHPYKIAKLDIKG